MKWETKMNKKLVFAIAATASICLSGAASADTINFSSGGNGADIFTSTTIAFTGKGDAHPVSGIFAPLDCTNCVTMANFNSGSTNFQVASISAGGQTDI